ncbi:MAG: hypothetical protein ACFFCZ_24610 [Promethearchaeota archaeon]
MQLNSFGITPGVDVELIFELPIFQRIDKVNLLIEVRIDDSGIILVTGCPVRGI